MTENQGDILARGIFLIVLSMMFVVDLKILAISRLAQSLFED